MYSVFVLLRRSKLYTFIYNFVIIKCVLQFVLYRIVHRHTVYLTNLIFSVVVVEYNGNLINTIYRIFNVFYKQ